MIQIRSLPLFLAVSFGCLIMPLSLSGQDQARFERSFARLSLDDVDFTPLAEEARKRKIELEDHELQRLIYSNFQFVLHNKLNRQRFLTAPPPDHLILKICELFQLNDRLGSLIGKGRVLVAQDQADGRVVSLVQEMEETAHSLKKNFGQYFLESRGNSMTIPLFDLQRGTDQFILFLFHAEKIQQELSSELTDYFLSPAPGMVTVADYQARSIGVLAESIRQVSRWAKKKLELKRELQ